MKEKSFNGVDKNGKMVSSINYDFTINTDYANYIENENGSHSYTFKVIRENPEFLLENLVMASKNDSSGGYNLYLTQYNITQGQYDAFKAGANPNFENSVTLVKLVEDGLVDAILNKETIDIQSMCMQSNIIPGNTCPSGQHTYLNAIECEYLNFTFYPTQTTYSWESCTVTVEVDTGGGGSTGGGSNGDPIDPTDGYDPTDPDIHGNGSVDTLPTDEMPLEDEEDIIDVCNKLSFLTYQVFTDVIYNLQDEYYGVDESSYTFFNTFNPANQIGTTQRAGFRGQTEFVLSSRNFGTAHIHNNVVEPMFSFSDLLAPCAFANQYQEPTVEIPFDDLFFNMMVINGFTYIIFPNDPMTFKNELNYIQENRLNFDIELGMIYKKLTKNNAVQSDYEKTFLEFIESIGNSNLNISMYVIENNASSFQNRGWQKVDLDSTSPNGIKKTNCN